MSSIYMDFNEITITNNKVNLEFLDKIPIEIYVETKKRRITYVKNIPYNSTEIKEHINILKRLLNCNGAYKNNMLLFSGDHKNKLYEYFKKLNNDVKLLL